MSTKHARELAATAWCKPATRDKVMDVELAEAFAGILEQERLKTAWYGHKPRDLEDALCLLWGYCESVLPDKQLDFLSETNSILDELRECGVHGPVGIGLGRIGGHAVGDED